MNFAELSRLVVGLVSAFVACVAVARGASLRGVWRWGPWTVAGYAYCICAVELVNFHTKITPGTIWIFGATFLGLGYAIHIMWAWRNPDHDLPKKKIEENPDMPINPGIRTERRRLRRK